MISPLQATRLEGSVSSAPVDISSETDIAVREMAQSTAHARADDSNPSTSGPTSEENAFNTESTVVASGGRERRSSLVVSDNDSWSELDNMSEPGDVYDFVSVDVERDDRDSSGRHVGSHGRSPSAPSNSASESKPDAPLLSGRTSKTGASEKGMLSGLPWQEIIGSSLQKI